MAMHRLVFVLLLLAQGVSLRLGWRSSTTTATSSPTTTLGPIKMPESSPDLFWDLHRVAYSLLPLAPGPRRKTIFEEVVPGSVWTMDQIQGVVNVNVPVRGVAVKLRAGGLLLYNPVAPTKEMVNYIRGLAWSREARRAGLTGTRAQGASGASNALLSKGRNMGPPRSVVIPIRSPQRALWVSPPHQGHSLGL
jgi:Domain of unknown function (DUF4336)